MPSYTSASVFKISFQTPSRGSPIWWSGRGSEEKFDDAGDHLTVAVVAEPGEDVSAAIVGVDPGET